MTGEPEVTPDGRIVVNKTAFSCVVLGRPAAQGSKRHVGGGRMIEMSEHLPAWREAVKTAANNAAWAAETADAPWMPLDGPLRLYVCFTLRKPASAPKRRRTWPDRTPDLSKLVRGVEDALTDAGIWVDDARVVHLLAEKVFPGESPYALPTPGCAIKVWKVTDAEQ